MTLAALHIRSYRTPICTTWWTGCIGCSWRSCGYRVPAVRPRPVDRDRAGLRPTVQCFRATASPTKRTTPSASGGRAKTSREGNSCAFRPRSPATQTSTTPGIAAAAVLSTPTTRAWATGERTNTAKRQSCGLPSSVKLPAPVMRRGSSRRLTSPPSIRVTATPRGYQLHQRRSALRSGRGARGWDEALAGSEPDPFRAVVNEG